MERTHQEIVGGYDMLGLLGKGTNSEVYLARHLHSKQYFAIKKVYRSQIENDRDRSACHVGGAGERTTLN